MANSYTNIRLILDKILRHPLLQDVTLEQAIDYTIDFMRIVGSPQIFEDKIINIDIENYKGILPEDFYEVIQIRNIINGKASISFRYTTDNFHLSDNKSDNINLTYKIQNNIIHTSIKDGTIELSYKAILVDDEGFPLIPDNSNFTRALELYIKKQVFTILFDLGKISPNSYNNVLQEYAWAVGSCESEFQRLTIDKAESFFNSWRTLLIRDTEHKSGFINNGSKEYIKSH